MPNKSAKIKAVITIVDTKEVTEHTFPDVNEFMETTLMNVAASSIVLGRELKSTPPELVGDHLSWRFMYADTGEVYMTIEADRLVDRHLH